MSHSIIGADRQTHVRIVAVSCIAAAVFVITLIAARVSDPTSNMLTANAPTVLKAERATVWTSKETTGAAR
jgi:hypothetical protein